MTKFRWFWMTTLCALLLCPIALAEEGDEEKEEKTDDGGVAKREVKLESNGAEPRKALRYAPTKGAKHDLEMKLDLGLESVMGAMQLPTIIADADFETAQVGDDKQFQMKITFSEVKTEGEDTSGMGAMLIGSIGSMKGLECDATFSCTGELTAATLGEAAIADPSQKQMADTIRDAVAKIVVPLPTEAVGVGAKWNVTEKVKTSNIDTTVVTTYEVAKIDGDLISLKHTIKQTAEKQKVQHPMGFEMELTEYNGEGTGTSTIDLGTGLCRKSASKAVTEASMSVDMGMGQPQQADQTITLEIQVAVKPATVTTGKGGADGDGAK